MGGLHEYHVVGRKQPTEADPSPQLYRMRIFAISEVMAKSRFWYFLHQYHKMKKSTGEVVAVNEIREKNVNIVKNYGISIKYHSRTGVHNMYKEYRDVALTGAVEQLYSELAGRHRARFGSIQIVDTRVVPGGKRAIKRYNPELHGDVPPIGIKRPAVKQFLDSKLKFPMPHRIQRAPEKKLRSTFNSRRPTTYFK